MVHNPPLITPRYVDDHDEPDHADYYGVHTPYHHSNRPFIPDLPFDTPYTHSGPHNHRGIPLPDDPADIRAFPSLSGYHVTNERVIPPPPPPPPPTQRSHGPWQHGHAGQWLQDPPRPRRQSLRRAGGNHPGEPFQRPRFEGAGMHIPADRIYDPFYINPFLNVLEPMMSCFVDLSRSHHAFQLSWGERPPKPLSDHFLNEPATFPPRHLMRITIDELPQWPCDLRPRFPNAPPILLRDVYKVVYKHLQHRVSAQDWNQLNNRERRHVSIAFQARCMRDGPENFWEVRNKGLRRVDFLMGNTRLVGLVWNGRTDGGWEMMKLALARV